MECVLVRSCVSGFSVSVSNELLIDKSSLGSSPTSKRVKRSGDQFELCQPRTSVSPAQTCIPRWADFSPHPRAFLDGRCFPPCAWLTSALCLDVTFSGKLSLTSPRSIRCPCYVLLWHLAHYMVIAHFLV